MGTLMNRRKDNHLLLIVKHINLMQKFHYLFLILIAFLSSCRDKNNDVPKDVIPPAKMTELLVDFHLAESSLAVMQYRDQKTSPLSTHLYDTILKKYNLSQKDFKKSMDYYSHHLEQMSKIYEDVITQLNKKQTEIQEK